jgi:copper chaperone CopZ
MKKTIIQLETLTCPSCVKRIEGTLAKQSGIDKVEVKFNSSKVEVTHQLELSSEEISSTIEKLGYEVLNVKSI